MKKTRSEEETSSTGAPTHTTSPLVDSASEISPSDHENETMPETRVYSREVLLFAAQVPNARSGASLGFRAMHVNDDAMVAASLPPKPLPVVEADVGLAQQAFRPLKQLRTEFWQRTGGASPAADTQPCQSTTFRSVDELCEELKHRVAITTSTADEDDEAPPPFRSLQTLREEFRERAKSSGVAKVSEQPATAFRRLDDLIAGFSRARCPTNEDSDTETIQPMRPLQELVREYRRKKAVLVPTMRPLQELIEESEKMPALRPMADLLANFRKKSGKSVSEACAALAAIGLPPGLEHLAACQESQSTAAPTTRTVSPSFLSSSPEDETGNMKA